MAAQRKKGKNSQKAKSAKPGPAKSEAKPTAATSDKASQSVDSKQPSVGVKETITITAPSQSKGASKGNSSKSKASAAAPQAQMSAPATDAEAESVLLPGYSDVAGEVSNDSALASQAETPQAQASAASLVPTSASVEAGPVIMDGVAAAKTAANDSDSRQSPGTSAPKFDPAASPSAAASAEPAAARTATLTESKPDAAAPPPVPQVQGEAAPSPESLNAENFAKSEIRTLLVPVSPVHRLIACAIVLFCYSILGHIVLKAPPGINAHGMHTVDLPEPGCYVLFFKGDLEDPYGWAKDGRFRNSLEIDMEPIEPYQKVVKVDPIKDISGANFFTVAEFEINQPGKYNLWIKWNKPQDRCTGKIYFEKDPVEKFFVKWALGIIGTIALFFMAGIPMTTSKAQSTLQNQKPPA